jgi:hypothetical protein
MAFGLVKLCLKIYGVIMKQTKQESTKKKREPVRPSILDPNFKYINAAATDVTQTWRRFGWKPTGEKHD